MHQYIRPVALTAAVLLASCGDNSKPEELEEPSNITRGAVGSVTFDYDAKLLSLSDIQLALPPDGRTMTFAVKLVPARQVGQPAERECSDEGGSTHRCTLAEEPGLTLALLEQPYGTYSRAWRSSEFGPAIENAKVDGEKGITFDAGKEQGLEVNYTLVPVDERALLIKEQSDGETARESAALSAVIASLDLPG